MGCNFLVQAAHGDQVADNDYPGLCDRTLGPFFLQVVMNDRTIRPVGAIVFPGVLVEPLTRFRPLHIFIGDIEDCLPVAAEHG